MNMLFLPKEQDIIDFCNQTLCYVISMNPTLYLSISVLSSFSRSIQLWPFANGRLLNKPYENEVTLTGQNLALKCCQPFELSKGFRSFNAEKMGSVGQRAAKLLNIKH